MTLKTAPRLPKKNKQEPLLNIIAITNALIICASALFLFSGIKFVAEYKEPAAAEAFTEEEHVAETQQVVQSTQSIAQPVVSTITSEVSIAGTAEKKPAPAPAPKLAPEPPKKPAFKINSTTYLLDDFNGGSRDNYLGFKTGVLAKKGGTIKYFVW